MNPFSHHTSSLVVATAAVFGATGAAALYSVRPSGRHSWLRAGGKAKVSPGQLVTVQPLVPKHPQPNLIRQPFLPMRACRAARLPSHHGPGRTYARAG
jgi:hypothetical protein